MLYLKPGGRVEAQLEKLESQLYPDLCLNWIRNQIGSQLFIGNAVRSAAIDFNKRVGLRAYFSFSKVYIKRDTKSIVLFCTEIFEQKHFLSIDFRSKSKQNLNVFVIPSLPSP